MPGTSLDLTRARSPFGRRLTTVVAFAALVLVSVLAMAMWVHNRADAAPTCTKNWIGPAGGLYQTNSNWQGNARPTATDFACAPAGSSIVYSNASVLSVTGVDFSGSSFTISNTELRIGSGTGTGTNPSIVGNLTVDSIRGGNSALTVNGTLTINNGGALGSPYSAGTARGGSTIVAPGGTYNMTADLTVQSNMLFRNNGTVTWTAGNVAQNEYSTIENAGSWTLPSGGSYVNDNGMSFAPAGVKNKFVNKPGGVVIKEATGFDTWIYTPFENDGSVVAHGDAIHIQNSFAPADTDSGTWTIDSGATIDLTEDRTFTTGASVSGAGTLELSSGGTIDLGPATAITNLWIANNGFVKGSPVISHHLQWDYGTFTGSGTAKLAAGATGVMDTGGSSHGIDNGFTFRNEGDLTWAAGYLTAANGATFQNAGQLTITDTGGYGWYVSGSPVGKFVNTASGTITKNATGATNYMYEFENHGAVHVKGDSLVLYGQPVSSTGDNGTYTLDTGATLDLQGDRNFATSVSTGAGTIRVASGTITGNLTASTAVTLDGGTISGNLDVTGSLAWNFGNFDGAHTATIEPGATLNIGTGSDHGLSNGYTFINKGTATWSAGHVHTYDGSLFENRAALTITDTGGYGWYVGGTPVGKFVNTATGTITKNATGVPNYMQEFENHGAVHVKGDSLVLHSQPAISTGDNGTYNIDAGATLTIQGDRNFVPGVSSGAGTLAVTSGTITGTLTASSLWVQGGQINGNLTASAMTFDGGTIAGNLDVSSSLLWNGGTFDGAHTATVLPGATLNIGTSSDHGLSNGYTFINKGTATWSTGHVHAFDGSLFENRAALTITDIGGYGWYVGGATSGKFVNTATGTITKNATGVTNYMSEFENHGAVHVKGDSLLLYSQPTTSTGDNGTYSIDGGATLTLQGDRNFVTSLSSGAGTIDVQSGTITGTLNVTSAMLFQGGVISADLTVSGSLNWTNGTFDGAHTATLQAGSTTAVGTTSGHSVTGGYNLVNQGGLTWATGHIYLCDGSSLHNSGTINITDVDGYSIYDCGTGGALVNDPAGVITKAGANNTHPSYINTTFTNNGKVSVSTGRTLHVQGDLTNLTGTTLTGGIYEVLGNGKLAISDASGGIITNAAVIRLNGATPAIEDGSGANAIPNLNTNATAATLEVLGGKTLSVIGPFTNAGTVTIGANSILSVGGAATTYTQSVGLTNLTDATAKLRLPGATAKVFINGGRLTGVGTVEASLVTNAARVQPGLSPGILTITGAYTQTSGGTLAVELNGTTVGTQFDRLAVSGAATLAGTLEITTGYAPVNTDAFTVMTQGSRTGTFSTLTGNQPTPGQVYRASYTPTTVTLTTSAAPVVSIGDASKAEGDSGTSNLSFPVTLDAASPDTVTVHWSTSPGTATAPSDYTTSSGIATFTPGLTTQNVIVPIVGDTADEANETFTVTLDSPVNAVIGDGSAVGTILNDEAAPTMSIGDATKVEGNSGTSNMAFTVTLSKPVLTTVTAHYQTADGSATAPSDYTNTSGTATFLANATTATINVPIVGDLVYEGNETFTVVLSAPSGATIVDGSGLGTIQNDESLPAIAISDAAQAEGNTGTSNLGFVISLDKPSQSTVTVQWATSAGSATSPSDYTAGSGTATFVPFDTSEIVNVPIVGDTTAEPDETFSVVLTAPAGGTLSDATAVGTIQNDDAVPPPTISISDAAQAEGNTGTTNLGFLISLNKPWTSTVTVHWGTSPGTATAPGDFTTSAGTASFGVGVTTQTVNVPIVGDLVYEGDETFTVNLDTPTVATIADGSGLGTIQNDETLPAIAISDAAKAEGNTGTSNLGFVISLDKPSQSTVAVQWATLAGTATSPSDYTASSGTATFTPGLTTQTVNVPIVGDTAVEPDESFTVVLSSPTGGTLTDSSGLGTIQNDDAVPTVSINDVTQAEGNSGTSNQSFLITLSTPSAGTVSVDWATAPGTATSPSDYTTRSGTATFTSGVTTQTVDVPIVGDTAFEANETFTVGLSSPVGSTIADGSGLGTIQNDDATPAITVSDAAKAEGNTGTSNLGFSITLTNASSSTVTVNWATAPGTATSPGDFTASSGTATFTPGVTTQTVNVPIVGDTTVESDEAFAVNLDTPAGATIADGAAVGTIQNDDAVVVLPAISISDVAQLEGNSGTSNLGFLITMDKPWTSTVTVHWATAPGTATSPSDFTATSGTATFVAGDTSETVNVPIIGDTTVESDEAFTVTLDSPVGATIADNAGTGTIQNDDAVVPPTGPVVSIGDAGVWEGDTGNPRPASFPLTLSQTATSEIDVQYRIVAGTATGNKVDVDDLKGGLVKTLKIKPNLNTGLTPLTKAITVKVTPDLGVEGNESYTVQLVGVTGGGASLGRTIGVGTIYDDDPGSGLRAGIGSVATVEGNNGVVKMQLKLTLSAPAPGPSPVSVKITPSDISAVVGVDYKLLKPKVVVFNPGQFQKAVSFTVFTNTTPQIDRVLQVGLSDPVGLTIQGSGIGQATIRDDD